MNKELKYLILFSLLTLFGCGNEEDAVSGIVPPQVGETLQLTVSAADFVTDGAPDTRATDNGKETTFDDNDRVGVIILDAGDNLIYDNIPYVYKSGKWTFDSGNNEGKGGCYYDPKAKTYIVYYPYSRDADGVKGVADLKTKFAPKFNQSNIEDYRASDLMVWSSNTPLSSSVKELNAELKHAFASVYLTPTVKSVILDDGNRTPYTGSYASEVTNISDVSLTIDNTVYVPFKASDGSLRCIVPAGITPGDIRCFYTIGGKTYGNTISISGTGKVAANTRYACEPKIGDVTYSFSNAHVGDFYCKNNNNEGYLIPGDVALTIDQQKACLGIVYCTDFNRIGQAAKEALKKNGVTTPHGLVMALANASEQCRWGEYDRDENNTGTGPFQSNTSTLQKQYNNIDGYGETHWILNTYRNNGTTLQDTYTAFYHASRYGTAEGGTSQYAAPNTTTGWFIPSMGQWWDILSNLGGIDLTTYQGSGDSYAFIISGAAQTAIDNMNKYLGKIEGTTMFSRDTYFWSSSEYSSGGACDVGFYIYDSLDLYYGDKGYSYSKVRCVFAF